MKTLALVGVTIIVSGILLLAHWEPRDPAVAIDPSGKLRFRLGLVTNASSECASGLSVSLDNLTTNEPLCIEVANDLRYTFAVSVRRLRAKESSGDSTAAGAGKAAGEFAQISKGYQAAGHGPRRLDYTMVTIPPRGSRSWTMEFGEIVDLSLVPSNVLTGCSVSVLAISYRGSSPRFLLSTSMTNVCIALHRGATL